MTTTNRSRTLAVSAMVSIALHGAVVFAFALKEPAADAPEQPPISVRLVTMAIAPPPAGAAPAPSALQDTAARRKPASRPRPPSAPAPELEAATGAEEPPAEAPLETSPGVATDSEAAGDVGSEGAPPGDGASSAMAAGPVAREPSPFGDMRGYLGVVQDRVRRGRDYPAVALRLRLEGIVQVRVRVNADGSFVGAPFVISSSGHALLDQAALRMITRAAPFPPLPVGAAHPADLTVPVQFHLEG